MKKFKFTLMLAPALLMLQSLSAQTADDIIQKYIHAIGGKQLLGQVHSLYEECSISMNGSDNPDTIYILNGKGYKSMSYFQGQEIVQCVTDTSGWTINPYTGGSDPVPLSQDQIRNGSGQLYALGPFYDYAARGFQVTMAGREMVGSVNAYKLKVTGADSVDNYYYFDPNTSLLIQSTRTSDMNGQQVQVVTTFSNYQKTDFGLLVPQNIDINLGQFDLALTVHHTEFNKPMDPSIFAMPK